MVCIFKFFQWIKSGRTFKFLYFVFFHIIRTFSFILIS